MTSENHTNPRAERVPNAATDPRLERPRRRFGVGALALVGLLSASLATGASLLLVRGAKGEGDGHAHADGEAPKPRYQCPMHPDVVQDHPGDCPICGMKLVQMPGASAAKTAAQKAPAKARYQCPMHPAVAQDHPGDCPLCGMKLVQVQAPSSGGLGQQGAAAKPQYVCPMHPNIVQDHPGDCPICGMNLVASKPAAEGSGPAASTVQGLATVEIDPARQQLVGLRTAPATRGTVGGAWRTVGRVAVDETRVRRINVKVPVYVERVFVDFVGKPVKQGEPLFSVYSPELLVAQEEYLLALRTRKALKGTEGGSDDGDTLVKSARRKLQLWDVPEAEIEKLEKTGVPSKSITFYSPIAGVVTKKDAVEGMKLDAGAMPYELVDLSQVWVLADVYESELRHVRLGMQAKLSLNAYPDRPFQGRVSFIDPLLDPKTRTVKVRLAFVNSTGELRPEMFGDVVLQGQAREALRIPADAVIDSGNHKVVFLALGDGKFQPREVKLGDSDGTNVEVVSGLQEGDQVVTRANFLVDSESRLRASLASMAEEEPVQAGPGGATAPEAAHGDAPPASGGHAGHASH